MANRLGLTLEQARRLMEGTAMRVAGIPAEARDQALAIVENAFRQMYVTSGAGEEQTREGVETLMKGVRLLVGELDAAGSEGGSA